MTSKHTATSRLTTALALATAAVMTACPVLAQAAPQSGDADAAAAITLYHNQIGLLTTMPNGVRVTASGYGSSFYRAPATSPKDRGDIFYGLTDRGPNVDADNGDKIEPVPSFQPAIEKFRLVDGRMVPLQRIGLVGADGGKINGAVNTEASTGETIVDVNGKVIAPNADGMDPEGLVVAPDGTFYVSDEYGPFITHFDASGHEIGRLSPYRGTLPGELRFRTANKGMEGLTLSPDGKTLYGSMQAALETPDLKGKSKNVPFIRIVAIDTATMKVTGQYLYLLHSSEAGTTVSEISALGNHTLLVDERDGDAGSSTFKRLYRIDLARATNLLDLKGEYDADKGGLLVKGQSLEGYVSHTKDAKANEVVAQQALEAAGITPATGSLFLDVTKLVWGADPSGATFSHDKVEGVAVSGGGTRVTLSNDSDFALSGSVPGVSNPYQMVQKTYADGIDVGEALGVDMRKVPARYKGAGFLDPTLTASTSGSGVSLHMTGLEPDTTYQLYKDARVLLATVRTDSTGRAADVVLDRSVVGNGNRTLGLYLDDSLVSSTSTHLTGKPNAGATTTSHTPRGKAWGWRSHQG